MLKVRIAAHRALRLQRLRHAACLAACRLRADRGGRPERRRRSSTSRGGAIGTAGSAGGTGGSRDRHRRRFADGWHGRKRGAGGYRRLGRRPVARAAPADLRVAAAPRRPAPPVRPARPVRPRAPVVRAAGAALRARRRGAAARGHRQRWKRHGGSGTAAARRRHGRCGHVPEGRGDDSQFAAAGVDGQSCRRRTGSGASSRRRCRSGKQINQPSVHQRLPGDRRQRGVLDLRRVEPRRAQAALHLHDAQQHRGRGREPHGLVRPLRQHLLHGHDRRPRDRHLGRHQRDGAQTRQGSSRSPARTTATTPRRCGASPGRGSTSTSARPTTASRSSTPPIPPRRRS